MKIATERIIFEKKGWRLSEIPYNYVIIHKDHAAYYTSITGAINWISRNSDITIDELKESTKGCYERPYRIDVEKAKARKREDDRTRRNMALTSSEST